MSTRPAGRPIGMQLTATGRAVGRAFDEALVEAGGSLSTWLVLMSLKRRPVASQRELAAAVGIQGATLTHHLNAMESAGLLTRRRDPANRRIHVVELTEHGEAAFQRMRAVAVAFDRRLRTGMDADDIERLSQLLGRLHDNIRVDGDAPDGPESADPAGPGRGTMARCAGEPLNQAPAPQALRPDGTRPTHEEQA